MTEENKQNQKENAHVPGNIRRGQRNISLWRAMISIVDTISLFYELAQNKGGKSLISNKTTHKIRQPTENGDQLLSAAPQ